jgi:HSP20 family protein
MSFNDDFDEMFSGFDAFDSQFFKKMRAQIDNILKQIKNGELEGTLEKREIKDPNVDGFIIIGRFGSNKALEPFEPIKPLNRRPLPENPFELPKTSQKEIREPLTDIFEADNATKIYIELPGEEKEDIRLDVVNNGIEIRANNFYKKIKLPNMNVPKEVLSTNYKNGVLEITIPKKPKLRKEDTKKEKLV